MKYTYIKKVIAFVIVLCCLFSVFGVTTTYADGSKSSVVAYGIDVSFWQGKIDWKKVKESGKTFAIIRAGSTKGKDDYFEENYKNAKAAGIYVGCYFYTYATTEEESQKDAEMLLSWLEGKQFEYPVFYDMENEKQLQNGLTTKQRTEMCLAFMDKMESKGWFVGTYANANWYKNYLDEKTLGEAGPLWLAAWTDSGEPSKDYSGKYGLWQYSDKGKVNGISGNVDLDVSYVDYPEIMRTCGYNGYSADMEIIDEEWVITSDNGVNVRELPGVVFEKVGFLAENERIHITAKVKDSLYTWGRIEYNGKTAWCVLNYAKKVKSTLSSNSDTIVLKDNLVLGLNEGEEVYKDLFKSDGLADVKIQQTKNGFGTGCQVNLVLGKTIVDTYYIVIPADINGDLYIDAFDLSYSIAITNYELDFEETSAEFMAADINGDGTCDIYDSEIIALMMMDYTEEVETPEEPEIPQEEV